MSLGARIKDVLTGHSSADTAPEDRHVPGSFPTDDVARHDGAGEDLTSSASQRNKLPKANDPRGLGEATQLPTGQASHGYTDSSAGMEDSHYTTQSREHNPVGTEASAAGYGTSQADSRRAGGVYDDQVGPMGQTTTSGISGHEAARHQPKEAAFTNPQATTHEQHGSYHGHGYDAAALAASAPSKDTHDSSHHKEEPNVTHSGLGAKSSTEHKDPYWGNIPAAGGVYNTVVGHGSAEDAHAHQGARAHEGGDQRAFPLGSASTQQGHHYEEETRRGDSHHKGAAAGVAGAAGTAYAAHELDKKHDGRREGGEDVSQESEGQKHSKIAALFHRDHKDKDNEHQTETRQGDRADQTQRSLEEAGLMGVAHRDHQDAKAAEEQRKIAEKQAAQEQKQAEKEYKHDQKQAEKEYKHEQKEAEKEAKHQQKKDEAAAIAIAKHNQKQAEKEAQHQHKKEEAAAVATAKHEQKQADKEAKQSEKENQHQHKKEEAAAAAAASAYAAHEASEEKERRKAAEKAEAEQPKEKKESKLHALFHRSSNKEKDGESPTSNEGQHLRESREHGHQAAIAPVQQHDDKYRKEHGHRDQHAAAVAPVSHDYEARQQQTRSVGQEQSPSQQTHPAPAPYRDEVGTGDKHSNLGRDAAVVGAGGAAAYGASRHAHKDDENTRDAPQGPGGPVAPNRAGTGLTGTQAQPQTYPAPGQYDASAAGAPFSTTHQQQDGPRQGGLQQARDVPSALTATVPLPTRHPEHYQQPQQPQQHQQSQQHQQAQETRYNTLPSGTSSGVKTAYDTPQQQGQATTQPTQPKEYVDSKPSQATAAYGAPSGPPAPGQQVIHQCTKCGEANDISHYFRK